MILIINQQPCLVPSTKKSTLSQRYGRLYECYLLTSQWVSIAVSLSFPSPLISLTNIHISSLLLCLNWREHVVFVSEHSTNKYSHWKWYKQSLKSKQLTLLAPNRCTAFNAGLIHFKIGFSSICNTSQILCGYQFLLAILGTIISHSSITDLSHLDPQTFTIGSMHAYIDLILARCNYKQHFTKNLNNA